MNRTKTVGIRGERKQAHALSGLTRYGPSQPCLLLALVLATFGIQCAQFLEAGFGHFAAPLYPAIAQQPEHLAAALRHCPSGCSHSSYMAASAKRH